MTLANNSFSPRTLQIAASIEDAITQWKKNMFKANNNMQYIRTDSIRTVSITAELASSLDRFCLLESLSVNKITLKDNIFSQLRGLSKPGTFYLMCRKRSYFLVLIFSICENTQTTTQ